MDFLTSFFKNIFIIAIFIGGFNLPYYLGWSDFCITIISR